MNLAQRRGLRHVLVTVFVAMVLFGLVFVLAGLLSRQQLEQQLYDEFEHQLSHNQRVLDEYLLRHSRSLHAVGSAMLLHKVVASSAAGDAASARLAVDQLIDTYSTMLQWVPDLIQLSVVEVDTGNPLLEVSRAGSGLAIEVARPSLDSIQAELLRQGVGPRAEFASPIRFRVADERLDDNYPALYTRALPLLDNRGELQALLVAEFDAARALAAMVADDETRSIGFVVDAQGHLVEHAVRAPNEDWRFVRTMTEAEIAELNWQSLSSPDRLMLLSGDTRWNYVLVREMASDAVTPAPSGLVMALARTEAQFDEALAARQLEYLPGLLAFAILTVVVLAVYQYLLYSRGTLLRQKKLYESIVHQSITGSAVLSPTGEVQAWNRAAVRMTGFEEEDAIGRNVFDLLRLREQANLDEADLRAVTRSGGIEGIDDVITTASGDEIEVSIQLYATAASADHEGAYVLGFQDISEEKRLQSQLLQQNARLERVVEDYGDKLAVAREDAQEAHRMKAEFLANMGHEIRTPIVGIFGMLRLLRQDTLTERQEHRLFMAESGIEELTALINEILDLSRIEEDKLDLEIGETNLHTLLHKAVRPYGEKAGQREIELALDSAQVTQATVRADAARLSQVVTSLLETALEYGEVGGRLLLTCTSVAKGEQEIMLEGSLSGDMRPIPAEQVAALFEPFSRVEGEGVTGLREGGLGLALAKHLCSLMDGELTVTSGPGMPTTLQFYLRLECEPDAESPASVLDLNGKVAWVIDEYPASATAIGGLLAGNGIAVSSGASFRDLDGAPSPDILVIDTHTLSDNLERVEKLAGEVAGRVVALKILVTGVQDTVIPAGGLAVTELAKPVTSINLEDALLDAHGIERGSAEDEGLSEAENRTLWRALSGKRALIVDDDKINQRVLGAMLEEYEVEFAYAGNGEQAINMLRNTPEDDGYDFVLMDCQMPVMDGYECTRRIRSGQAGVLNKKVPVIAVTVSAAASDRNRCLEAGMDDYVSKPVQPRQLERKLLAMGRKRAMLTLVPSRPPTSGAVNRHKVWDREDAMRRMMYKEDILQFAVAQFIEAAPERLSGIKSAVAQADVQQLNRRAHDLKGMAANIGARALVDACFDLEVAALEGEPERCAPIVMELSRRYDALVQMLQDYQTGGRSRQ